MADWYVNQKVISSGDGTSLGTAFKTIKEFDNVAVNDDRVYISSGVYLEDNLFQVNERKLRFVGIGNVKVGLVYIRRVFLGQYSSFANMELENFETNRTNYFYNCIIKHSLIMGVLSNSQCVNCTIRVPTVFGSLISSTIHNCIVTVDTGTDREDIHFNNNVFSGTDLTLNSPLTLSYCGLYNSRVRFSTSSSLQNMETQNDLVQKKELDLATTIAGDSFNSTTLINSAQDINQIFNNISNHDYTLKPFLDSPANTTINPFATGSVKITKIGKYDIALNWQPSDFTPDVNGSNVDGLHKISGAVAVFDAPAKDWGIPVEMNWLPTLGTIFDRDGVILCAENPSNFTTRQISALWAFSNTDATTLDAGAGSTYPYLAFLTNKKAYYVDNGGTLVGNGDSAYQALVDGGLIPIALITRSLKPLIKIIDE